MRRSSTVNGPPASTPTPNGSRKVGGRRVACEGDAAPRCSVCAAVVARDARARAGRAAGPGSAANRAPGAARAVAPAALIPLFLGRLGLEAYGGLSTAPRR